jgi:Tfp pilus assembly protein PilF
MMPSQKQLATSICIQFGEHYLAEKDYARAVRSYKDALAYSPTDNKVSSPESKTLPLFSGHETLLNS